MRGHTKHRHNLSHHFTACRCHLGLKIQFTPASIEETGGIFEKIVAGVTGLEPATSCVTGAKPQFGRLFRASFYPCKHWFKPRPIDTSRQLVLLVDQFVDQFLLAVSLVIDSLHNDAHLSCLKHTDSFNSLYFAKAVLKDFITSQLS